MKSKAHKNASGRVLLSGRFRYAYRFLLFGRARLYRDRIVFSGMTWTSIHRRTVLLSDVARVSWRTNSERSVNMTLYLQNGESLRIWLNGAGLWKYRIEERLGNRLGVYTDIPGEMTSASAA
ncbi:MAG: hypothetical protein ACE5G0_02310 [Rhodothermales bacterium]